MHGTVNVKFNTVEGSQWKRNKAFNVLFIDKHVNVNWVKIPSVPQKYFYV
jgi:hypothetical protein